MRIGSLEVVILLNSFLKAPLPKALGSDNALGLVSYGAFYRQEAARPGFLRLC